MPNEEITRGPAVSDGREEPSDRAELVIVLKNVASGDTVIWRRGDYRTGNNVSWFGIFLRWSL